jgi:hypothetical protein
MIDFSGFPYFLSPAGNLFHTLHQNMGKRLSPPIWWLSHILQHLRTDGWWGWPTDLYLMKRPTEWILSLHSTWLNFLAGVKETTFGTRACKHVISIAWNLFRAETILKKKLTWSERLVTSSIFFPIEPARRALTFSLFGWRIKDQL